MASHVLGPGFEYFVEIALFSASVLQILSGLNVFLVTNSAWWGFEIAYAGTDELLNCFCIQVYRGLHS